MAKIIKRASEKVPTFEVNQHVSWYTYFHDGRISSSDKHYGTIVKVNRVTLKVEDLKGNIWSVERSEASPL